MTACAAWRFPANVQSFAGDSLTDLHPGTASSFVAAAAVVGATSCLLTNLWLVLPQIGDVETEVSDNFSFDAAARRVTFVSPEGIYAVRFGSAAKYSAFADSYNEKLFENTFKVGPAAQADEGVCAPVCLGSRLEPAVHPLFVCVCRSTMTRAIAIRYGRHASRSSWGLPGAGLETRAHSTRLSAHYLSVNHGPLG